MTVIVAVREGKDSVVVGGDQAGVTGHIVEHRADPKVFRVGAFTIGFTTSFRMGQLIEFDEAIAKLTPPKPRAKARLFMHREFIPALRTCLRAGGILKIENNVEEGGTFIVAWGGNMFCVHGDLQVEAPRSPYLACGSGWQVALGALHILTAQGSSAWTAVERALKATEAHVGHVQGPMTVMWT